MMSSSHGCLLDGIGDRRNVDDPSHATRCTRPVDCEAIEQQEEHEEGQCHHEGGARILRHRREHQKHRVHGQVEHRRPQPHAREQRPRKRAHSKDDDEEDGVGNECLHRADEGKGHDVGPLAVQCFRCLHVHDPPFRDQLRHTLEAVDGCRHHQHKVEGELGHCISIADVQVGQSYDQALADGDHEVRNHASLVSQIQRELPGPDDRQLSPEAHAVLRLSHGGHAAVYREPRMHALENLQGAAALSVELERNLRSDDGLAPFIEECDEFVLTRLSTARRYAIHHEVRRVRMRRHGMVERLAVCPKLLHRAVVHAAARARRQEQQMVEQLGNLRPRLVNHNQDRHAVLVRDQPHVLHTRLCICGRQARSRLVAEYDLRHGRKTTSQGSPSSLPA
mmetsp:Transcript_82554/g.209974  ORF Transcript_82554/g.209974 Transcript_82554/m.209974 type:complete len:393 (-) Transcript_82554:704-1882(-)